MEVFKGSEEIKGFADRIKQGDQSAVKLLNGKMYLLQTDQGEFLYIGSAPDINSAKNDFLASKKGQDVKITQIHPESGPSEVGDSDEGTAGEYLASGSDTTETRAQKKQAKADKKAADKEAEKKQRQQDKDYLAGKYGSQRESQRISEILNM